MRTKFQELKSKADQMKTELRELLETLPDSVPGVTLLTKTCGVINSSNLQGSWCPRYYLTVHIKQALRELIDNSNGPDLVTKIERVIESGEVKGQHIHPTIVDSIKSIWG